MTGANQSKRKKASISEEDISLILQRYTATTILALLQEVAQFSGVKIDWNALVKKTSTGISNAREYQMLWRHLAYHDTLLEKLEDGAEPVDDDSDLEFELEPFPSVNAEASTEAAACVKVLIASGMPSDSGPPNRATVEAPLTINIPNGQASHAPSGNLQQARSTQGMNITIPVSVQKQSLPSLPSSEQLDGNGTGSANLPARRKRKLWTEEEDLELIAAVQKCGEGNWANILKGDFKHDRTASQLSQRWAIIRKKKPNLKPSNARKSTGPMGPTLSEAQLAARQAVSMALNMPMMGSLSSASAVGVSQPTMSSNASTLLANMSEASTAPSPPPETITKSMVSSSSLALHQSQQPPNTAAPKAASPAPKSRGSSKKQAFPMKCSTGPNPIVQAAAVAAGARIANPITAATLFRAAQSKTAVHIRQGGSVPASSLPAVAKPLSNSHIGPRPANIHYIRTGLASPPPVYSSKAQSFPRPTGQQIQGASGRLPSAGHPPPTGPTAPPNRLAQQVGMETKTASHSGISPRGKAEIKMSPSISTVDGGLPSTEEKKSDSLVEVPKESMQEPVASVNSVPKEPMQEPVASVNSVPKELMQETVLLVNSVPKEPMQEPAALVNSMPREPIQENVSSLNSNAIAYLATISDADNNQTVVPKQTNISPTVAEELQIPQNPDAGENQTAITNSATENQNMMGKTVDSSNDPAGEKQIVVGMDNGNQTTIEKQTHLENAEACKNLILSENVKNESVAASHTGLPNTDDAGSNESVVDEMAGKEQSDLPNNETGNKMV